MVSKKIRASFPSTIERIAASALLLLSTSLKKSCKSWRFSSTKSICGGETSVNGESSSIPAAWDQHQLMFVSHLSRFNELNLKDSSNHHIVRKKRSKCIRISNDQKLNSIKSKPTCAPAASDCVSVITADTSSCLSFGSIEQSCGNITNVVDTKKKSVIYGHMALQAEAILSILSNGSASEVRIRKLLGDSPTTSKALRMLLKLEQVKRSGTGGRADPYIYKIA